MRPTVYMALWMLCVPVGVLYADVPGSGDHPLIPRYPGSEIVRYTVTDYDEYTMATGPRTSSGIPSAVLEGKHTRILYQLTPTERSTLEVFRNYEKALQDAGFEVGFSCGGQSCGRSFSYEIKYKLNQMPIEYNDDTRYLTAHRARPGESTIDVALAVQRYKLRGGSGDPAVFAALDIIESAAMDVGMELKLADEISRELDADGRSVLYGIRFDTDSATIRPESADTLAQIAELLEANPDLRLLVVGHTDNQGSLDYNLDLSNRRAAAVVEALTGQYGIGAGRLSAHGVGFLAPTASNANDEGRAMNRRVELVPR